MALKATIRPVLTSNSFSQTEWRLTDENHSASV